MTAPGTADVVVRPARADELPAVGALTEASYRAAGALDGDSGYEVTLRDAVGRAAAGPVLVAEREGALVGTVTICPWGTEYSELAREGETEFRFLAVAPEAWGAGIGPLLVDAVESYARGAGSHALVLFVLWSNDAAHRLYARLGFSRVPDRDWEPVPGIVLQAYRRGIDSRTPG
ncbi:MAG: GNAT family N-acetyltransferase [Candidatus Nanopelagicales bacterium]